MKTLKIAERMLFGNKPSQYTRTPKALEKGGAANKVISRARKMAHVCLVGLSIIVPCDLISNGLISDFLIGKAEAKEYIVRSSDRDGLIAILKRESGLTYSEAFKIYKQVGKMNKLPDGFALHPGQIIQIPSKRIVRKEVQEVIIEPEKNMQEGPEKEKNVQKDSSVEEVEMSHASSNVPPITIPKLLSRVPQLKNPIPVPAPLQVGRKPSDQNDKQQLNTPSVSDSSDSNTGAKRKRIPKPGHLDFIGPMPQKKVVTKPESKIQKEQESISADANPNIAPVPRDEDLTIAQLIKMDREEVRSSVWHNRHIRHKIWNPETGKLNFHGSTKLFRDLGIFNITELKYALISKQSLVVNGELVGPEDKMPRIKTGDIIKISTPEIMMIIDLKSKAPDEIRETVSSNKLIRDMIRDPKTGVFTFHYPAIYNAVGMNQFPELMNALSSGDSLVHVKKGGEKVLIKEKRKRMPQVKEGDTVTILERVIPEAPIFDPETEADLLPHEDTPNEQSPIKDDLNSGTDSNKDSDGGIDPKTELPSTPATDNQTPGVDDKAIEKPVETQEENPESPLVPPIGDSIVDIPENDGSNPDSINEALNGSITYNKGENFVQVAAFLKGHRKNGKAIQVTRSDGYSVVIRHNRPFIKLKPGDKYTVYKRPDLKGVRSVEFNGDNQGDVGQFIRLARIDGDNLIHKTTSDNGLEYILYGNDPIPDIQKGDILRRQKRSVDQKMPSGLERVHTASNIPVPQPKRSYRVNEDTLKRIDRTYNRSVFTAKASSLGVGFSVEADVDDTGAVSIKPTDVDRKDRSRLVLAHLNSKGYIVSQESLNFDYMTGMRSRHFTAEANKDGIGLTVKGFLEKDGTVTSEPDYSRSKNREVVVAKGLLSRGYKLLPNTYTENVSGEVVKPDFAAEVIRVADGKEFTIHGEMASDGTVFPTLQGIPDRLKDRQITEFAKAVGIKVLKKSKQSSFRGRTEYSLLTQRKSGWMFNASLAIKNDGSIDFKFKGPKNPERYIKHKLKKQGHEVVRYDNLKFDERYGTTMNAVVAKKGHDGRKWNFAASISVGHSGRILTSIEGLANT